MRRQGSAALYQPTAWQKHTYREKLGRDERLMETAHRRHAMGSIFLVAAVLRRAAWLMDSILHHHSAVTLSVVSFLTVTVIGRRKY
jgi:hypothetical protein